MGRKFGYNADVDSGAAEDVWSVGGVYPFPVATTPLWMQSSDNTDGGDPDQTGALTVGVWGLDGNWAPLYETVQLRGVTGVFTQGSFLRVNNVRVLTTGKDNSNNGIITIKRTNGGGDIVAEIPAQYGAAPQAVYSTPAGFGLSMLTAWWASAPGSTAGSTVLALQVRPLGGCWRIEDMQALDNVNFPFVERSQRKLFLNAQEDIRLRVLSSANSNLIVSGGFDVQWEHGANQNLMDLA